MSSRRDQKGGKKKYIKEQDIQNEICISDEDSSNEILLERDIKQAERESGNRRRSSRTRKVPVHLCCCEHTSPNKHCSSTTDSPGKSSDLSCSPNKTLSSQETKDCESTTETKKLALNRSEFPSEEPTTTGETEDSIGSGKKRNPLPQNPAITSPKRVKKDLKKKMSDIPDRVLQVELLMEKKREPFKRRSINTIMEELDTITRKLKEGYEKSNTPNYWGTPIVKQSSEKWDPNYIPEQLLELYEKRFEMNQPCTSSSLSESTSESLSDYKSAESKTNRSCPEGVDEEAYEASEYEHLVDPVSDDLYGSNIQGRMTLRSMTQNRQGYEERISSDAGKDNYGMDRHMRKGSGRSGKDKRSSAMKRRAISELERTHDPHSQFHGEEGVDPNSSFEKLKLDDSAAPSTSLGGVKSHLEEKAISLPPRIVEEEQVACPICGKNFEKKRIESLPNYQLRGCSQFPWTKLRMLKCHLAWALLNVAEAYNTEAGETLGIPFVSK